MTKLVVTGSLRWQNRIIIKDFIFNLKQKYTNSIEIISGGMLDGVDLFVKKYCREFDVKYSEIPPSHYMWNQYCVFPYIKYGKEYRPKNIFIRNERLYKYGDVLVIFRCNNETADDAIIDDLIIRYEKRNKKVLIFS